MKEVNPKVTVYIPSHNYGSFLEQAVESVLRQSYENWELILIDDNSTDNTLEVMKNYAGDPRIRIIEMAGVGLIRVCNRALAEARGEYIIRLDGDDIFDENILLVLSHYLDSNTDSALVFPDHYLMDEYGEVFGHERRQKIFEQNHMLDAPPHGACTLVRASVLREIGGYSEHLNAQDGYYLWSKILGKYKCGNVNLPLFYYRRHGENLTNSSRRILEARRQIKKETIILELDDFRPFIGVIPCRRNYDFSPDIWNLPMHNSTLLSRAIENCLRSSILDHVVVVSDNPDTESILKQYNDSRLIFSTRDAKETIRSRSVVPTLEKAVKPLDPEMKGVSVLAKLQTPFVTTDTLEEAIFTLVMNKADCSFGVQELSVPLYRRSAFGLQALNKSSGVSSDFDKVYCESRAMMATRNKNLLSGSLTGPSIVNFIVGDDESFFIDSERDYQIAEIIDARRRTFGE